VPNPSLAGFGNPMSEQMYGLRNRDIESAKEICPFVKRLSLAVS